MKLFDIREAVSRAAFRVQNIRYLSKRHYMTTVFLLLFIMLIIFTSVFISQRKQLERKENIVRSFYIEAGEDEQIGDAQHLTAAEEAYIKVHVCGEVINPGVYEAEKGSRVIDLINIAGGGTEKACLDLLNLAQEAFDGQKIYVPSQEEAAAGNIGAMSPASQGIQGEGGNTSIININTASSLQLESLPGIGPVTAGKIIDHREKYGAFKQIEDLMNISGIGPKKFEQLKDFIDV